MADEEDDASTEESIDWHALREQATQAAENAYAPYSKLSVGAAAITSSGVVVTGCNVENASFGLTLCAECGLVSDLHRQRAGSLVAIAIVDGNGDALAPCGRCRQLLYEFGGPDLLLDADAGPVRLDSLLPNAFGPNDLPS